MHTLAKGKITTEIWTPTKRLIKTFKDYGHTEITQRKWLKCLNTDK